MRKILLAVIAVVFIIIYAASSFEPLMKIIVPYRYEMKSELGSDKYAYGDLYGISYLPQFRIVEPPNGAIHIDVPKSKRDINLYGLVDSYIYSFVKSDSVFYGVKKYWFSKWADPTKYTVKVNPREKNVLFLQSGERYVSLWADTDRVFSRLHVVDDTTALVKQPDKIIARRSFVQEVHDFLFDKDLQSNLEFNLFNYRLFSPLKELKAKLNDKIFNRVDNGVIVSKSGKYLFLNETADTSKESSFRAISQNEIDKIVWGLNKVYDRYKPMGFDEIYLVMVPNPVSIIEPNDRNYNFLISRIQNDPKLKIKFIDLYSIYKNSTQQIYKNSDSHYTNTGFKILIDELNKNLITLDKR
jgi:hypothetical protein